MRSVIGKNWNKSSIRLDTSSSNHQFAVLVLIDWRYIIQVFIDDIANSTKTEKNPCGYFLSHVRESKIVLDFGFQAVDSGLQVLDSGLCVWNLDSGFQS